MNKRILLFLIVIVAASLLVYFWRQSKLVKAGEADRMAVADVVYSFGKALKNVSLLSPTASEDIYQNYKDYVAPELIGEWQTDPSEALGRYVSSPWPDRIEISDIRQSGSGAYEITGKIIEITSQEGVIAATREVDMAVVKFGQQWLISSVTLYPYSAAESWKVSNANGIEFEYPGQLNVQYISTQTWPPVINMREGSYSCRESAGSIKTIEQRVVNSRIYCVESQNEGAAGSVYSTYTYITPKNGDLASITFTLRYPNCGNYNEEENLACTNERQAFDLDSIVDRIAASIKQESESNTLANQIADCIVKSDMQSKETCDGLLKQINDFNSCAMAGFSIMESNPLQCTTPDGRIFVQDK